jgi:hypothetical protein
VVEAGRLVEERYLIKVLEDMGMGGGGRCICPSQLGIRDNTSFLLYHDTQTGNDHWVIMNDPVVTRHSGKKKDTPVGATIVTHYEEITVTFDSPAHQLDSHLMGNLLDYNKEIIYYNPSLSVLRRIEREYIHRISVHLEGKAVACYVRCESLISSSPPSI